MQNIQERVKDLCKVSMHVIANPQKSPREVAQELGLSPTLVDFTEGVAYLSLSLLFTPIVASSLYLWRKYSETEKRKLEKERMLREVIAKQQAVIKTLEREEARMRTENLQNQIEIENLKQMLLLLEQLQEQVKKAE